jgi:hypothetical protein
MVIKSEAAWERFRERTNGGEVARRAKMEFRPDAAKAKRARTQRNFAPAGPRFYKRVGRSYVEV